MKRYLQSVEEVVKTLEERKSLKDEQYGNTYKLVDSLIYCYSQSGSIYINDVIAFDKNNVYTEEPEQLKFEINRAYKVECGKKVFIESDFKDDKNYRVFFENGFYFIDYNGKNCLGNTKWNIVGYWEEEK